MKPQFERVTFPPGCSLRVYDRHIASIPFEWHHHPEYELTLTLNSRGWRFVGDHAGTYEPHDLVLVPSEMPHTWASTAAIDEKSPHIAIVVWFKGDWALNMAQQCPEYAQLFSLMRSAHAGLCFDQAAGMWMETQLPALLSSSPRDRLHAALEIFIHLAHCKSTRLASAQFPERAGLFEQQPSQLDRILDLLHRRYADALRIKDLCAAANVSERSLHRLFTRHLGENAGAYLRRLRTGRACLLLAETDWPINRIAIESGFANLANFNRQFREARGMTPKEFRRLVKQ